MRPLKSFSERYADEKRNCHFGKVCGNIRQYAESQCINKGQMHLEGKPDGSEKVADYSPQNHS